VKKDHEIIRLAQQAADQHSPYFDFIGANRLVCGEFVRGGDYSTIPASRTKQKDSIIGYCGKIIDGAEYKQVKGQ
jgi:hypothetical protein